MSAVFLRKYHKERIDINPFVLSGNLYSLIDNGCGGMIENKSAVPDIKTYTNPVRISHEKRTIQTRDNTGTPVTTEKRVYYMISDYETPVDIRLEFIYNDFNFKVLQRKKIIKYGSLIGYEYELQNLTEGRFNA